ncbi:hypothetical protein ACFLQL_04165 [Verrucomicrobiota bacterium]
MKERTGFVSNSSSSSFMFALPEEYDGKIKVSMEVDLKDFGTICKTKKQLDKYLLDKYEYKTLAELFDDFTSLEEKYREALKQIWEGKVIAIGKVDDEGGANERMLIEDNWTIQDFRVKQIGEISY